MVFPLAKAKDMDFPDFFSMVSKDGPLAKTLPFFEHSFLVLDGRVLEKKSTSVSESQSVGRTNPKEKENGIRPWPTECDLTFSPLKPFFFPAANGSGEKVSR